MDYVAIIGGLLLGWTLIQCIRWLATSTKYLAFSSITTPDSIYAPNVYQFSVVRLHVSDRWRRLRKILNSYIFSSSSLDANQHLRCRKIQNFIAYCHRCSQTGKEFKDVVWSIMEEAGKSNLADYFHVLKRMDPQGIRRRIGKHFGKLLQQIQGLINERLDQRTTTTTRGSTDDLFAAGTDTSSNTLEWAMVKVMRKPHIMRKAKAIGQGKAIEETDVAQTLRMHPPVTFLIRKVDQNVEVLHVWSIDSDPAIWEDPLAFKPERFWGSKMEVCGQDFELIPFGAGRRICPGLPLATRILSVMLGSLLNSFDRKAEGNIAPEDLDVEEKFGITLARSRPLRAVPIPL
ncbi:unnamed protein product [Withania somnifera]